MEVSKETNLSQNLLVAVNAAIEAGHRIMEYYNDSYNIDYKDDQSPLTSADLAAHRCIDERLQITELPLISEEGKNISFDVRKLWEYFWLVDPLDGTKEFIKRNGEFTVNIALIYKGYPILGVVYIPVSSLIYFGCSGYGSFRLDVKNVLTEFLSLDNLLLNAIRLPEESEREVVIMGSRSHNSPENLKLINSFSSVFENASLISAGSSLKFCRLAEGSADFYPRISPTMEWDTAAGHAICRFADTKVINYESGLELNYNKASLLNPNFIAIRNRFSHYLEYLYKA